MSSNQIQDEIQNDFDEPNDKVNNETSYVAPPPVNPTAPIDNNNNQLQQLQQPIQQQLNNTGGVDTATIVTVQVPYAVPVQVPVPVEVPVPVQVPVYVPVNAEQLQQLQQQQQLLAQQQPLGDSASSTSTDTTRSQISPQDQQSLQQDLEVKPASFDNNNNNNNNNNELSREKVEMPASSTSDVDLSVDTTKLKELASNAVSSVANLVKNAIGLTEHKKPEHAVFEQAKEPLMPSPIEPEDRKYVDTQFTSDIKNEEMKIKDLDFKQEQPVQIQAPSNDSTTTTTTKVSDNIEFGGDIFKSDQKREKEEEIVPLLNENNNNLIEVAGGDNATFAPDNNTITQDRKYRDIVGGTSVTSVRDDTLSNSNKMIAGDSSAFKDIDNITLNTKESDVNTLSQPTMIDNNNNNNNETLQLTKTKETLPSQKDNAPQISSF
jgi:hypothetical protein